MTLWQDYTAERETHTVIGKLRVCENVYSPQLDNERDIYVWLPPSYGQSDRRYPVVYMHDGQNLFDAHISYSGEWEVDEAMTTLAAEGIEAIIVGIPNNEERALEYNPFKDANHGAGKGEAYMAFLVETVKPLIDTDFLTLPERENTVIAGSSMGGLISLYGFFRHGDVFGGCGAFSPAYWFAGNGLISFVERERFVPGKIYMDIGTREGVVNWTFPKKMGIKEERMARYYVSSVRKIYDILRDRGYDEMMYVEEEGAPHHESAWARRLPDALRFLLG